MYSVTFKTKLSRFVEFLENVCMSSLSKNFKFQISPFPCYIPEIILRMFRSLSIHFYQKNVDIRAYPKLKNHLAEELYEKNIYTHLIANIESSQRVSVLNSYSWSTETMKG